MTGVPRYRVVVGTGGIGAGIAFALHGDHTLGREESRAATLLDARDYCKLHIVVHHLRRFHPPEVQIMPIGRIGDDDAGRRLAAEMTAAGLDLRHVATDPDAPTLFAVAFSYPNGDGGNLTALGSASDQVTPDDIRAVEPSLIPFRDAGIAIALPEVPLPARVELLTMATELGFLRVGTFVSGEAAAAVDAGLLERTDLLVLNRDEAAALTGEPRTVDHHTALRTVERLDTLRKGHSTTHAAVVTAGSHGSWSWDGARLEHAPALVRPVRSTAGAGDAHLAGIVTGLTSGLDVHAANRFGALVSGLKVTSAHTINPDITAGLVLDEAEREGLALPQALLASLRSSDG